MVNAEVRLRESVELLLAEGVRKGAILTALTRISLDLLAALREREK